MKKLLKLLLICLMVLTMAVFAFACGGLEEPEDPVDPPATEQPGGEEGGGGESGGGTSGETLGDLDTTTDNDPNKTETERVPV